MGCDIHIVLERRKAGSGEWVGLWCSDTIPLSRRISVAQRDYEFFAQVAGVRGSKPTTVWPRNLPEDVSRLAWTQYMLSPTDYHHPSHLTPAEFAAAWRRANPDNSAIRKDFELWDLLHIESGWPEGADYRVVFWFDN